MEIKLLPAFVGAPAINQVYHTDLFTLCDAIPPQSVDMILCDLPYGTTACAWDEVIPFAPMWARFKRVIKAKGAIALTSAQPFTSALVMSNPRWFREELVWEKQQPKGFLDARRKHLDAHETVLLFAAGQTTYNPQGLTSVNIKSGRKKKSLSGLYGKVGNPDYIQTEGNFPRSVLHFDVVHNGDNLHPTQKPVALFEYLIRTYTQPGDLVLDPCVGSGTTGIAARNTQRRFICGDTSAKYVEVARKRLAAPYTKPMFEEVA